MAGIYIHIPYCRKACHYCNFHFSTSLATLGEMIRAIVHEIQLQHHYLAGETVETIYFGGGTPSLLHPDQLAPILDEITQQHHIIANPEITLEANPEDIHPDTLHAWKTVGINRLSIGIQGFQDDMLANWNRAHNAAQAKASLHWAHQAGFNNISADLIYGSPELSDEALLSNMDVLAEAGINHISCYALTVETGTALHHQINSGKAKPIDDDKSFRHFQLIQEKAARLGFMQYEVSNFCKPGYLSQHNTSYWKGIPYLGIGPAAHSFNGESRQWNVANNAQYMRAIESDRIPFEIEMITPAMRYNEMVMTGLRTMWGIDALEIRKLGDQFDIHLQREIQPYIDSGKIMVDEDHYILHPQQYFFADGIASHLFFTV